MMIHFVCVEYCGYWIVGWSLVVAGHFLGGRGGWRLVEVIWVDMERV